MPYSGSSTSPVPVMTSDDVVSATASIASRRRRIAVGAPVLRQLDGGALQLALMLVELRLEALEQRERVGSRAGKSGEHAIVVKATDLARRRLDRPRCRA